MNKKDFKNLQKAYNAVFDERGQIKNCGRDACIRLITLMKRYTSKNIGNEDTGTLETDTIKSEFYRIIVSWHWLTLNRVWFVWTRFLFIIEKK